MATVIIIDDDNPTPPQQLTYLLVVVVVSLQASKKRQVSLTRKSLPGYDNNNAHCFTNYLCCVLADIYFFKL